MDTRLLRHINSVMARFRAIRLCVGLGIVWAITAIIGGLLYSSSEESYLTPQVPWLILAAAGAMGVLVIAFAWKSFHDHHWIAQQIERKYPELSERLLTAIALRPTEADGQFTFLQREVIDAAVKHAWAHPWKKTVSNKRLLGSHAFHLISLTSVIASMTLLLGAKPPAPEFLTAQGPQEQISASFEILVTPGNAEIERGSNLLITAKFSERENVPRDVSLVILPEDGNETRTPMAQGLDDPLFGGHVAEVVAPFRYRIDFADRQSESYSIGVFEFPEMLRADAQLEFPSYLNLADKLVEDTRRISAVEGTKVTWICQLNKIVASAALVTQQGDQLPLVLSQSTPHQYSISVTLQKSTRWTVQLTDHEGRANKHPPELIVKVLPNRVPEVKLVSASDTQVSPIEELLVQASVQDDYGLNQYGISYGLAGTPLNNVVLGEATARKERRDIEHLLDFEAMHAEPDQLLSYHFWVEDFGPDGAIRRVLSDIFFAEVRHFEEIFRQGEQPPAEQQQQQQQQQQSDSQNRQQAQQLGELQKQIINGTWNVIRRERADSLTDKYTDDVALLLESQTAAIQQVEELASQIEDAESLQHVDSVRGHMQQAIAELKNALTPSFENLELALAAEQASYQGLLKLRAREHEIIESQSSQSPNSSSSSASRRSREQLQELELKNDDNRYETERQAETEEDETQRELRQILSRLRDLARRQEDINEQLKELEAALEAAETVKEEEELRRQLKRLREQQEEMLRDTDELLDRMDQADNQPQIDESRQQLEETRENVRQSAESMEEQDVSQALSAGTRAEREFEDIRDEFRQEAASQFEDVMRDIQQQARTLDENQKTIGQQLAELNRPQEASLRDPSQREQIRQGFEQQQQQLNDLLEQIQDTVQEAEEPEPLLAQNLYDSFRNTTQERTQNNLEAATDLIQRGFDSQAKQLEEAARESISTLREGIEKASDSLLGDPTDALRQAASELDKLTQQLNEEIDRSDPQRQDTGDARRQSPASQRAEDRELAENADSVQEESTESASPSTEPANQSDPNKETSDPQESSRTGENPSQTSAESESEQPTAGQGRSLTDPPSTTNPQNSPESAPLQETPNSENRLPPGSVAPRQNSEGFEGFATDTQRLAPLTGDNYRDWTDRLRDVEEMIEDPELRGEAARIRDRMRGFRQEFKRHSEEPQWSLVRKMVAQPLEELRGLVAEELLRRSAERQELVPIDRDPVPQEFTDRVRLYYEQLGIGN